MGGGLLMHSLGLSSSSRYWLGVREGAEGLSACKLPSWSVESCIIGNLLDGCWITQHYGDSLGSPMAMLTVGLGDAVLSQESYWAIVGQASGLGNLSCLDHTKLGGIQVYSVHMKCASHWG